MMMTMTMMNIGVAWQVVNVNTTPHTNNNERRKKKLFLAFFSLSRSISTLRAQARSIDCIKMVAPLYVSKQQTRLASTRLDSDRYGTVSVDWVGRSQSNK